MQGKMYCPEQGHEAAAGCVGLEREIRQLGHEIAQGWSQSDQMNFNWEVGT